MKSSAQILSLGLALLAGSMTTANAADWNYGADSIKDMGVQGIPVPAPVPVPLYTAQYYFRADAGIGFGDEPLVSENGYYYGDDASGGRRNPPNGSFEGDFENFVTLGVGVGTYWSETIRTDFTAETRSEGKVKYNGVYRYINTDDNPVRGVVNDETTLRGGLFLFNAYYDFSRFASYSLRPYIGAGVGFAWNELKRNHGTVEVENLGGGNRSRSTASEQDKTHSVSFAAAATVGATYKVSHNASLDFNYRFLYMDGADVTLGIDGRNFGGTSKVSIDETYEHQLRAGIRYDIN